MADIDLTGVSIIESFILSTFIESGIQENLTAVGLCYSLGIGSLLKEIKCSNCQFNNDITLTKNGPKCLRAARFGVEDKKTMCVMYKKGII